jgi:hypothetical protein
MGYGGPRSACDRSTGKHTAAYEPGPNKVSAREGNHQQPFGSNGEVLVPILNFVTNGSASLLTDASVEDEGVAQGDDDEGLNVTDGEHVDVRLGWPVVTVSPA